MSNIQYIKNVTVTANFDSAPGSFTKVLTGMPSINPDEVIVRSLNFNGLVSDAKLYLLWSNITNDIITSFCGASLAPHSPQTVIKLTAPVPNMLEFKLYQPVNNTGDVVVIDSTSGTFAIHLDFIKYTV